MKVHFGAQTCRAKTLKANGGLSFYCVSAFLVRRLVSLHKSTQSHRSQPGLGARGALPLSKARGGPWQGDGQSPRPRPGQSRGLQREELAWGGEPAGPHCVHPETEKAQGAGGLGAPQVASNLDLMFGDTKLYSFHSVGATSMTEPPRVPPEVPPAPGASCVVQALDTPLLPWAVLCRAVPCFLPSSARGQFSHNRYKGFSNGALIK